MSTPALHQNRITQYALPLLAVAVVVIILFFGLRPKEWASDNNIQWLADKGGLEFSSPSIAYVPHLQSLEYRKDPKEFTLLIEVAPLRLDQSGFRPLVMVHDGEDRGQLVVWQWGTSVIVMNGDDYDYSKKWPRISGRVFSTRGEKTLLSVTSSDSGTRLFVGKTLVAENHNLQLTLPGSRKKTRLILGNSVYGTHSWEGRMYGVFLSGTSISKAQMAGVYDTWRTKGGMALGSMEDPLLLYTFNGYNNGLIYDATGRNQPLQLPQHLVVLKRNILSSPAEDFKPTLVFLFDILANIIGFIPLGAVMYYWSLQSNVVPKRYEMVVIVVGCFLLSLTIESLQIWLPHRHSSVLDLICNTLGACLGVFFLRKTGKRWRPLIEGKQ